MKPMMKLIINAALIFSVAQAAEAQQLAWQEITPAIAGQTAVSKHFWIGAPDINADGCPDLFVGSHVDSSASAMYTQDKLSTGECAVTWTHVPTSIGNYSQASPASPRITSRFVFGDWYSDLEGLMSFYGHDVDSNPSARYTIASTVNAGGTPVYDAKLVGCRSWNNIGSSIARSFCYPIDVDGDGNLELYVRSRLAGNSYSLGQIGTITASSKLIQPDAVGQTTNCDMLIAVDADNDSLSEILNPCDGGYWRHVAGAQVWMPNTFPPLPNAGGNHYGTLDYDSDGDDDVFIFLPIYQVNGYMTLRLYRNDAGVFSDVSAAVGLSDTLVSNQGSITSYANSKVGDLDNDGFPEIVIFGESQATHNAAKSTVTILENNAGIFSVNRDMNFGKHNKTSSDASKAWGDLVDVTNDGRVDLVKTHYGYSVGVFANTTTGSGNWLNLHLRGAGTNTHGIGAKLTALVPNTTQVISSVSVAHDKLEPHLGLGTHESIDLLVQWPGRPGEIWEDVPANKTYNVYESGNLVLYSPGLPIPRYFTPLAAKNYDLKKLLAQQEQISGAVELMPPADNSHNGFEQATIDAQHARNAERVRSILRGALDE